MQRSARQWSSPGEERHFKKTKIENTTELSITEKKLSRIFVHAWEEPWEDVS